MQNNEYHDAFGISQSAIKDFEKLTIQEFRDVHIDKIRDRDEDGGKYAFGSLVDTLRFNPELMLERFYMPKTEIKMPSDKVKKIADKVYTKAKEIIENKEKLNAKGNLPEPVFVPSIKDFGEFQNLIYDEAKAADFGGDTWSRTRIIDHVFGEAKDYYRLLSECGGRYIITPTDNADAIDLVKILGANKDVNAFFIAQENETLIFQQEIFIDHIEGHNIIPVKGAVDILRFIHERKVVQIADLKTTFNSENFKAIAKKFNYALQLSFYRFLVKQWLKDYKEGIYADYNVDGFFNIVIDRKHKIPYLYQYTYGCIEIAENGSVELGITGWAKMLQTIAWHMETGVWDRPKEMYENGKIILNIYD